MYSKRNCACGNAEWRKSACTARGYVPAEIEDGAETQVRQADMYLRKWGMAGKRMYGKPRFKHSDPKRGIIGMNRSKSGSESATKKYPHDGMGTFIFTI